MLREKLLRIRFIGSGHGANQTRLRSTVSECSSKVSELQTLLT